jgi:aryl-alcohol dehydrogenase-like predicted oxidoreductase
MQQWTPDEDAAAPLFRQAVELGVTFWDTANVYQGGTSEEIVGRAISRFARREDIVLATKVSGKMHDGARRERPVPQGSSNRWTPPCGGWAPTTSRSTTSTA